MQKVIQKFIITVSLLVFPMMASPVLVSAACPTDNSPKSQVLNSVNNEAGNTNCDTSGIRNAASAGVQILSIVVGIAAVIMIVYAGFKYITSAGDSNKVSSAKTTLIYALVGVAIAVLAQVIVHFVLNNAIAAAPGS